MALPFRNRLQALRGQLSLVTRVLAALTAAGMMVAVLVVHEGQSSTVRTLGCISVSLWFLSAGIQIVGSLKSRRLAPSQGRPKS